MVITLSLGQFVALIGALGGGIIWLATLHTRIGTAKAVAKYNLQSHEELCGERYTHIMLQHTEMLAQMERLNTKLDHRFDSLTSYLMGRGAPI